MKRRKKKNVIILILLLILVNITLTGFVGKEIDKNSVSYKYDKVKSMDAKIITVYAFSNAKLGALVLIIIVIIVIGTIMNS